MLCCIEKELKALEIIKENLFIEIKYNIRFDIQFLDVFYKTPSGSNICIYETCDPNEINLLKEVL